MNLDMGSFVLGFMTRASFFALLAPRARRDGDQPTGEGLRPQPPRFGTSGVKPAPA